MRPLLWRLRTFSSAGCRTGQADPRDRSSGSTGSTGRLRRRRSPTSTTKPDPAAAERLLLTSRWSGIATSRSAGGLCTHAATSAANARQPGSASRAASARKRRAASSSSRSRTDAAMVAGLTASSRIWPSARQPGQRRQAVAHHDRDAAMQRLHRRDAVALALAREQHRARPRQHVPHPGIGEARPVPEPPLAGEFAQERLLAQRVRRHGRRP